VLKRKVAQGAAHMALFQLSGKVMDIVAVIVLARILSPADFGVVALASSVMLIAAAVTEMSVIDVLVQRQTLEPHEIDAAFTLNALRGGVVFVTVIGLGA